VTENWTTTSLVKMHQTISKRTINTNTKVVEEGEKGRGYKRRRLNRMRS